MQWFNVSTVFQVVEVFICRVKPVDNDIEWTYAVILRLFYEVCLSIDMMSMWFYLGVEVGGRSEIQWLLFDKNAVLLDFSWTRSAACVCLAE